MSRRRSGNFNGYTPDNAFDMLEVVTVPQGARFHLWDDKTQGITDAFFVTTGPLRLIIRRDHGPVYGMIKQLSNAGDSSHLWNEAKDVARSIPLVRGFIHEDSHPLLDALANQYMDADAIFMAYSKDGKQAIKFTHPGRDINPAFIGYSQ